MKWFPKAFTEDNYTMKKDERYTNPGESNPDTPQNMTFWTDIFFKKPVFGKQNRIMIHPGIGKEHDILRAGICQVGKDSKGRMVAKSPNTWLAIYKFDASGNPTARRQHQKGLHEAIEDDLGDVGDFQKPELGVGQRVRIQLPSEEKDMVRGGHLNNQTGTITRIIKDKYVDVKLDRRPFGGRAQSATLPFDRVVRESVMDPTDEEVSFSQPLGKQSVSEGTGLWEGEEGFGRSETGPLGREEEPKEPYEDLGDVSEFDIPAGRYGTSTDIKVTHIGNEYHARLFADGKLVDEMACKNKEDIGWVCREMMRWYSKMGGDSAHAENARERHNEEPTDLPSVRRVSI
jgi:hypothetical protein